jgi:hypothetical protein
VHKVPQELQAHKVQEVHQALQEEQALQAHKVQ